MLKWKKNSIAHPEQGVLKINGSKVKGLDVEK